MKQNAEEAWQSLTDRGWALVPDNDSIRVKAVRGFTGRYVSYYDPKLEGIMIVLHSQIRQWAWESAVEVTP